MEKFYNVLEEKMMPLGQKINNVRFLKVIRMSMMPVVPFIITGSLSLIILYFPYIDKIVPAGVMSVLTSILSPISGTTLSLVALFLAFLMGYNYAKTDEHKIEAVYAGLTTLIAFLIVSPSSITVGEEIVGGVIPTAYLGSQGMFVALIIGYLVAMIYCKLITGNLKIKLPDGVPPMVADSFESLVPAVITLILVCLLNYGFTLTSFGNIHVFVNQIIQKPLLYVGTGLPALLITQTLVQLLWFFGLQGDQIVGSVMEPILQVAQLENMNAYTAGKELPYIITDQFQKLFVMSAFISLVIAIIIVAKSNRLKGISKVAAVPAMFCISEPSVFGIPIVMNAILFIPWVLSRPLFVLVTWLSMKLGLCPYTTGVVLPWTTPPIISGFLATNSIMGAVVQIICLVLGVLLFLPFVKMLDSSYRKEEIQAEAKEGAKIEENL